MIVVIGMTLFSMAGGLVLAAGMIVLEDPSPPEWDMDPPWVRDLVNASIVMPESEIELKEAYLAAKEREFRYEDIPF